MNDLILDSWSSENTTAQTELESIPNAEDSLSGMALMESLEPPPGYGDSRFSDDTTITNHCSIPEDGETSENHRTTDSTYLVVPNLT